MSKNAFPTGYFGDKRGGGLDLDKTLHLMQRYKKKYFVTFINELPKGAKVLDVGCGKGKAIELIKALRPDVNVSGCDITDTSAFLPEYTGFICCGVEDLVNKYDKESFDAVICLHVIEHLVDPIDMMHGFLHLLKSGGKMFMETPNWTRLFIPFSRLYFWNDYTHIHPYCKRSFRRLFSEFGIKEEKVVSVSSVDYGSLFKSVVARFNKKTSVKKDNTERLPGRKIVIKKTKLQKISDGFVEFVINPFTRDILIGIARKQD